MACLQPGGKSEILEMILPERLVASEKNKVRAPEQHRGSRGGISNNFYFNSNFLVVS